MEEKYVLSIDQSTQGTKALLLDLNGRIINRRDKQHKQIIDKEGRVSHSPMEIFNNTISVVRTLIESSGVDKNKIVCVGLSNQRETSLIWDRKTGEPVADAIVWQCTRSEVICDEVKEQGYADMIYKKTGIRLSPYFPASKYAWILRNIDGVCERAKKHSLCFGTIDTWLIYKLTEEREYKTDFSNASRTQLFNIFTLEWDEELCDIFGIDKSDLPEVCDSDSMFGMTTLGGYLDRAIPIHGVLGDSHGALFGHGCINAGMAKATYGTGSSVMMNIGEQPVLCDSITTSLAWCINGKVQYALEGNVNYAGAVISWLKDDLKLIDSPTETEELCKAAIKNDELYFVPALTGLGAPHWDSKATGVISGITRTTGKNEIVRAAVEGIAYQISDIISVMREKSEIEIKELYVDGGPTRNEYLMQFQSNITNLKIFVPQREEFSGIGAAYMAGVGIGIYKIELIFDTEKMVYENEICELERTEKINGWTNAVKLSGSKIF